MQSSHAAGAVDVVFDDPNLIADAGLVPVVALAEQIDLPELVAEHVVITGAATVRGEPGGEGDVATGRDGRRSGLDRGCGPAAAGRQQCGVLHRARPRHLITGHHPGSACSRSANATPPACLARVIAWSHWRHRRQHQARACHYHRCGHPLPPRRCSTKRWTISKKRSHGMEAHPEESSIHHIS
jgi:hypothetical protein